MNAWMLPSVIWPVATCSPPTTATRDVAQVADERRRGRHQAGQELGAEAGLVDVVVEFAELLLGQRAVAERLDDGEAAVGLLDVRVEPAGVAPLRDEQLAASVARSSRVAHSDNGTVSTVISASSGEIVSIITSTATTVSTDVSSWLIVIDSDV